MDFGSIVFILAGISGIVGGYGVIRLRKLSIKDVRNKKRRPAVTGISAIILGTGIIVVSISVILIGILPRNETVRMGLSCTNITLFYVGIMILSLLLEGIRNISMPSKDK